MGHLCSIRRAASGYRYDSAMCSYMCVMFSPASVRITSGSMLHPLHALPLHLIPTYFVADSVHVFVIVVQWCKCDGVRVASGNTLGRRGAKYI